MALGLGAALQTAGPDCAAQQRATSSGERVHLNTHLEAEPAWVSCARVLDPLPLPGCPPLRKVLRRCIQPLRLPVLRGSCLGGLLLRRQAGIHARRARGGGDGLLVCLAHSHRAREHTGDTTEGCGSRAMLAAPTQGLLAADKIWLLLLGPLHLANPEGGKFLSEQ